MGKDLESIVGNPIGQPMATILFNSLNKKGALVLWAFVVVAQYMMGSSMVSAKRVINITGQTRLREVYSCCFLLPSSKLLAASRQTFAFSRDGALPFSRYLYRMNSYTQTPVNS